MSHAFRKYCLPLKHKEWRSWSKDGLMTANDIEICFTVEDCIKNRLSQDVVEHIIYLVFDDGFLSEEKIHQNNIIRWLEFWVKDKANQIHNPFLAVKNSMELANIKSYFMKLQSEKGIQLDQCVVMIKSPKQNVGSCRYIIGNIGILMGISFPPNYCVEDIEYARIYCNNLELRSAFVFDGNNSFQSTDLDGTKHTFYFLPNFKVIPTNLMVFMSLVCFMQPKPGKTGPKYITQIKCFNDYLSHDSNDHNPYNLNDVVEIEKENYDHHAVIRDGTIQYVNGVFH